MHVLWGGTRRHESDENRTGASANDNTTRCQSLLSAVQWHIGDRLSASRLAMNCGACGFLSFLPSTRQVQFAVQDALRRNAASIQFPMLSHSVTVAHWTGSNR